MKKQETEALKLKVLSVLARHVGRGRAIPMAKLHAEVYGQLPVDLVNQTRDLRRLITMLREDGVPVCFSTSPSASGYFLASAGSEQDALCRKLRKRALGLLSLEAKIRGTSLLDILQEVHL